MPSLRRQKLLKLLSEAEGPLTGDHLAGLMEVSRQVIVQDMAVLRAAGHPLVATARGYLLPRDSEPGTRRKVLAVDHAPGQTREELLILVDHGVKILDVVVAHPVYGELRADLMLQSRAEVERFLANITSKGAPLLLELTGGVHLHTVEYRSERDLETALGLLAEKGLLIP